MDLVNQPLVFHSTSSSKITFLNSVFIDGCDLKPWKGVLMCVCFTLIILSSFGNLRLQNMSATVTLEYGEFFIFVRYLCIVNLTSLFIIILPFLTQLMELTSIDSVWFIGITSCRLLPVIRTTLLNLSLLLTLLMVVERFYCTYGSCHVAVNPLRTTKKIILSSFLSTIIAFLSSSPVSFFYEYLTVNEPSIGKVLWCHLNLQDSFDVYTHLTTIFYLVIVPFFVIIFAFTFTRTTCSTYIPDNQCCAYFSDEKYLCVLEHSRKTDYAFVWSSTISFFLFLIPYKVLSLSLFCEWWTVTQTNSSTSSVSYVDYVFQVIMCLYCTLNPFVYYVIFRGFEKDLKKLAFLFKQRGRITVESEMKGLDETFSVAKTNTRYSAVDSTEL